MYNSLVNLKFPILLSACFLLLAWSTYEPPRNINTESTPLHNAAASGDVAKVELLLSKGVSVDIRSNITKATPLHFASWKGRYETAKRLIEKGADVNATTKWGATPIHYASGLNSPVGLNPPCQPSSGLSEGHFQVARLLLGSGASAAHRDGHGNTALGEAASANDVDIARLLIDNGADLNAREVQYTPLDRAAVRGPDVAILLVARGAEVNEPETITKETPLHAAAACGYIEVVRVLLQHGANTEAVDQFGNTPLDLTEQAEKYTNNDNFSEILRLLRPESNQTN